MTICIAAICKPSDEILDNSWFYENGIAPKSSIVGISDRMVSDRYTQSELPQPKFRNTVNSVMVLMAGVTDVSAEIFDRTDSYISKDFMNYPQIIPVERIANIYSQNLATFLKNRRDTISRGRTGLYFEDFIKQHHTWPQELSGEIIKEIKDEPATETIVTGIDESGAHIYLIDTHGYVSCQDSTGFALIGSGSFHANSQLMLTKHSPMDSHYDTLLLAYMAKKQAELDPWVGKNTDMFVITDGHDYNVLSKETVNMLEDTYNEIYNKVLVEAKTKIQEHLIKERETKIVLDKPDRS